MPNGGSKSVCGKFDTSPPKQKNSDT